MYIAVSSMKLGKMDKSSSRRVGALLDNPVRFAEVDCASMHLDIPAAWHNDSADQNRIQNFVDKILQQRPALSETVRGSEMGL
jgi:hypothetical protein